jgi:hypothetical protein
LDPEDLWSKMDSGKPLEPWQYRVSIRDTPATCLKVETYFVEKTQSEDCRGVISTLDLIVSMGERRIVINDYGNRFKE